MPQNKQMRSRRFVILATILVTLNVGLWLASSAFGLAPSVVTMLFGKSMVRTTVLENNGAQWNLDRGTVVSATPTLLTIREANVGDGGRVQPIQVSAATVVNPGPNGAPVHVGKLKPGWRVLVLWPASGPANTVWIEKR
jgi:hypothetical protein